MYYRIHTPLGERKEPIQIPGNYAGNLFAKDAETQDTPVSEELPETADAAVTAVPVGVSEPPCNAPAEKPPHKLLSLPGSFGVEELMLLGLAYLSMRQTPDDDLWLYLIFLLLCG